MMGTTGGGKYKPISDILQRTPNVGRSAETIIQQHQYGHWVPSKRLTKNDSQFEWRLQVSQGNQ